MEEIEAKTIVYKTKSPDFWFGNDYNMNLYRGCCHGCIYCDSRSECYGNDEFDIVKKKKDAINLLERDLSKKRKKGVIGIGAMSDTYNPYEKKEELTRQALRIIKNYHFGVSLETKSDLVVRDIDVFKDIAQYNDVIIKMTITCADDHLSKMIEPNVSVSSKRFAAIKMLSDAGLFTGVLMTPLLPYITDTEDNIKRIVRLSYENGAKFVFTYFGVTMRDRQRAYYFNQLDLIDKTLRPKYLQTFGHTYHCKSPNQKALKRVFEKECRKYGLLYKMSDIIAGYKIHQEVNHEQLTLF